MCIGRSISYEFKVVYNKLFSILDCIIEKIFRVMAAALSLTCGRGGALMGNLLFGFLIDLNCVVPVVLFSLMLFGKLHYAIFVFDISTSFKNEFIYKCGNKLNSWKFRFFIKEFHS